MRTNQEGVIEDLDTKNVRVIETKLSTVQKLLDLSPFRNKQQINELLTESKRLLEGMLGMESQINKLTRIQEKLNRGVTPEQKVKNINDISLIKKRLSNV